MGQELLKLGGGWGGRIWEGWKSDGVEGDII